MSAPLNRRAALGRLAGAAALALPATAIAAAPSETDAEIIALSADIVRRGAEADRFQRRYIDVHQEEFDRLLDDRSQPHDARVEAAFAFSRESGREAAVSELSDFEQATDRLFNRLRAIPATTQPGRAAKVRALLSHVMRTGWRGPAKEMDWDKEMARELLAEFAGMSAEEVANV